MSSSSLLYSLYIINKAGGLIYQKDVQSSEPEVDTTIKYPLGLTLKEVDDKVVVIFGEREGIKVGHSIIAINGELVTSKALPNGVSAIEFLADESNYPISIRAGKPKPNTNERIMLASMFHSLFAISCKLSPCDKSSGIELLESNSFKLHCFQTITGVKFFVMTDTRVNTMDTFLKKLYELYGDFALKNPFYSLEMPIRCDLFDTNLQKLIEQTEKSITHTLGAT